VSIRFLVNVDVDDVNAAIAFYRDAFGLRMGRILFDGSVVEMLGGSSTIYLLARPRGSRPFEQAATARDYNRQWTPVHLDFVGPAVAQAVERAVAAGARLEQEPRPFAGGLLAMLSDPFGHGFCLIQFDDGDYAADA
jgi:predicted enzyme related to lactoylglutathione lyase